MRIVTLIENLVYNQGLVAEHGLSLYIESGGEKILFDTGQSGMFLLNAQKLGIAIEDIDYLVLSHGHYDHIGGLLPFFEKNHRANLYAKKNIFAPKYHSNNQLIGTLHTEALFNDRIIYVDNITEIAQDVFIMPDISIHNPVDTHFEGMYRIVNDEIFPDELEDELFLVLKQDEQINIVTACSHRGITNICRTATEHFKLPVGLILGGFHTKNCTQAQYGHIIDYFRHLGPQSIGVCHCTGVAKYVDLNNDLNVPVFYNYTGNEIIL
jgi:7,8-dihydropterin-6-yl-methyl-4-(beta-D-ribofuranosyl)aminobenzene 5'-phosphate synthase